MLYRDTDTSRQLASERHVELKRDWEWVNPAQPVLLESRQRGWRSRLDWLLAHLHLRPVGHAS
jgi:hypothetical protein